MFHMSNDSHLFRTRDELESAGFTLEGNRFLRGDERYLPLYEAKMMHQFTHRWATYTDDGSTRDMSLDELQNPSALVMPRYWVDDKEITARISDLQPLIGFRGIARSTDERTAIFGVAPLVSVGNSLPILQTQEPTAYLMTTNASMFIFDFVTRQKVGGTNFNFYIVQQLPVIPPHTYTPELLDFIVPRVLELTYTAWDLQPFAQDVGYNGAPFVWDEERRFLMRCELDALYFHLYGISRDDADYIMETFPIVKRKDEAQHGEYRTKRIILEMYDQMAALPSMLVPAPKDESAAYAVPDVSQWVTPLDPPPGDVRAAHGDTRE
jgi:hypothetical protein